MTYTTIKEVQQEQEKLAGQIAESELSIRNLKTASTSAFNSAKSYADQVKEGGTLSCSWKDWNGTKKNAISNLNYLFGGSSFTRTPSRTHNVKKKQHSDCGWRANSMWKQIDAVASANTAITLENQKLAVLKKHLKDMGDVHEELIDSAEDIIDLGTTQLEHDEKIEDINVKKAVVTKTRAESGLPITLLIGLGLIVIVALVMVFKKN